MPSASAAAEDLFETGRFEEALAAWRVIGGTDRSAPRPRSRIAACLVSLGRFDEALDILEPLVTELPDQPLLLHRLALARAGAGDIERSLDALEAAAAAGLRPVTSVSSDPAFDGGRDSERFRTIVDRIAHNDAPTADDARFRSFDFWVGAWEARTEDGVRQGVNRIERVLGGAAIIERWTGAGGYRGVSLNRYDKATDTWRQTWVDDQGDVIEFEDGRAADGRLVFQARMPDGDRRRLTFEDRGPDAFRQLSERSAADGATWTVEYDFRYRRLADDAAASTTAPAS